MTIQEALYACGVRPDTLTQHEKDQLDQDGYVALPGILSPARIEFFRLRFDELLAQEGEAAGLEMHQEKGTERLANLIDKDIMFQIAITDPRVLAGVAHVLDGDLKLSALNCRFALPGEGLQGLHADWGNPISDQFQVCNSIWLLDDFTAENGPTRVVPGSHRFKQGVGDVMADATAPHPDEKLVLGPAGTVVVFNSHLWHGGTLNRTTRRRRAMHSYFSRRAVPQATNQNQYLRPESRALLSEAVRVILDI